MHPFATLLALACMSSLLTTVEMYLDYSSPFNNPCGASATQAHDGDIAYNPIPKSGNREKRGATAIRERLWPNGRIPYEISPRYNTREHNQIYAAMREWENNTCIRFYERPANHNQSYVYFFKGGCCASYVGRQTVDLQQGISLGDSCSKFSTYLHEIGHAIGFWHEQSRPDRDEYIRVLTDNMLPGSSSNFDIQRQINSMGIGYDYNSIMHYSSTAFGNGRTTIVARDPSIPVGGAVELSELDIMQANLLYQCDMANPPPPEVPPAQVQAAPTTPPPLPDCHMDFDNDYQGFIYSTDYPSPYAPNQNCAYRIHVPKGTKLSLTIADLDLEWSEGCKKDSLSVYRSMDGSGYPQWTGRCGYGKNMTVNMDGNIAYVKFVSDGDNEWEGMRGFLAAFNAEDIDECQENNGGCSQTCVNEVPGHRCLCSDGWFLSGNRKTCFDMNECAVSNGGCQHKCRNTGGSFQCECPEGSTLNTDGRTCSNPGSSCAVDNGGCDHTCSDGPSGVSCSCRGGYRLQSDGETCRDIDECLEHNTCSYGGCRNTDGSYKCTCESGYEKDSATDRCINVNECTRGLHVCQGDAQCRDTDGAYECTCGEGLTLSTDKLSCVDINECQDSSTCSHECVNTRGSYMCMCSSGYALTMEPAGTCVDIDECLEGGCSQIEGATCQNTIGSFECQCPTGYRLSADRSTCEDIDECSESTHNCQSGCSNTEGSFVCTCEEGYMLKSDGRSCKCGGVFTEASGRFSTPGWPERYPMADFDCEWSVNLPNPEATIQFTIDSSAYGINGHSPCTTDYVQFFDGMGQDSTSMYKLCKFDIPSQPIVTSTSQGRVVFRGSHRTTRPASRVGVQVLYTTVEPTTAPPPTTTAPTTNPPTEALETRSCNVDNGGCDHVCSERSSQVTCSCREGFGLQPNGLTCTDIDECSERTHNCQSGCSNTEGSFVCTCQEGYMLKSDGRSCKCGGVFTEASGRFSTPGWPERYPMADFDCEWSVNLPNPEATIQFTIDSSAYGINGHSPCSSDYVQFFDGMGQDSTSMYKLCKFDIPPRPIVTSTSQGRVVFRGSHRTTRPASRVGVQVLYTTVEPTTAPPATTQPTTVPPTTNSPTTTDATVVTPPLVNECLNNNGGCQHECMDTPTSYYCSCRPGYSLNGDDRTCTIDCGGELTGTSGSFQTPDWPLSYPQAFFTCVWRIARPESSRMIRFTVDSDHFGINGRNPCIDHLQFFRGSGQSDRVGNKLCFLIPPTDPIEITSTEATIVFTGTRNYKRPRSRVGVKVYYEIVE